MGQYHFAVQYKGQFHKFFLNEDGYLYMYDKKGEPVQIGDRIYESSAIAREAALRALHTKNIPGLI